VSLITSADQVTDARLHRLSNAILKNGMPVDIWALGNESDTPAGSTFHKAPGGKSKTARIMRDLTLPFKADGEVVIVVAPDLIPLTYLITRVRGQKMVADVHEDYVKLLRDRTWARGAIGILARVIAKSATYFAAKADLTTVADLQVPPFNARKRMVIKNLPDISLITLSGELSASPRAIYIGDIRKSRGLHQMLEVAEQTPDWSFDLVGNIAENEIEFVKNWQQNSTASARVKFHGRLSPKNSWKFAEGAWVGLALLESTPAFVEAVPSKLYEYAAAGLATISTPLPRCVELINQSGGGAIATSTDEISGLLSNWAKDPAPLITMRQRALTWSREVLKSEEQYQAFASAIRSLTTLPR
jgi:glycosyltransferase involved in cell wall biosynthesis